MSRGRGGNALTLDLNIIPKRGYPCPLSMAAFTELIESTLSVTRTDRRSPGLVTFLALSSVTHTSIQDEFAPGGLSLRRPLAWRRNEHSARINSGLARIFDGLAALEENNNDTGRKHMAEATDLLGKAAYVFDRFSTASSDGSGLSTGNFTVTAVPSPGLL